MTRLRPRRDPRRWNHNIHYHRVVLAAVPPGCRRALDVGCGEGILTRRLGERADLVVGLDRDRSSISLAREQQPDGVRYVLGDLLAPPFARGSFDLVTAVASLHHGDARTGLRRMAELLRPGGVLVVVGVARSRLPADLGRELAAVLAHRWFRLRKTLWEHPSPVIWPPPVSYVDMRRLAGEVLPGARFRRHLLWRYSLVWRKPG